MSQLLPVLVCVFLTLFSVGVLCADPQLANIDNMHLRVVTIEQRPFVKINRTLAGNARFEGLAVDLWDEVFRRAGENVSYTIYEAPDGSFGAKTKNGSWSGTLGELTNDRADVIMGPLTILKSRMDAMDVTTPYIQVGLRVLIRKPTEKTDSLAFLKPFSGKLWVTLLFTAIAMVFVMYGLDRFSPYGYREREDDDERRTFNIPNSLFSSLMGVIGAGGDKFAEPRSWSSKIMILSYFFFILIVISSYTANLTAFLTVKRLSTQITGVDDVRSQKLSFAVVDNSAISTFFETTPIIEYMVMKNKMVRYANVDLAVEALRLGKVEAFIHASAIVDYIVNQEPCDSLTVGDLFNIGYYGIPVQKGSLIREALSKALLSVLEDGTYTELYQKWYFLMGACSNGDGGEDVDADTLQVSNLAGLFYMLFLFFGIAVVVLVVEKVVHAKRNSNDIFRYVNKFCGNHDEHDHKKRGGDVSLEART